MTAGGVVRDRRGVDSVRRSFGWRRVMARFLTTTGVSYHLEEIIKGAEERLVIISPFLRTNERIRSLFEDRDRLKIDIRVV